MKPIVYQGIIYNWGNVEVIENPAREPRIQLFFRSGRTKSLGFDNIQARDDFFKGLVSYLGDKQVEPKKIETTVKTIESSKEQNTKDVIELAKNSKKGAKK